MGEIEICSVRLKGAEMNFFSVMFINHSALVQFFLFKVRISKITGAELF